MGKKYDDVRERLAKLTKLRDRAGKEPLTKEERVGLLNEIYDGLLFLWQQCVITGTAKGTSSISLQLQSARLEMTELQRNYDLKSNHDELYGIDFTLPDYDETQRNN